MFQEELRHNIGLFTQVVTPLEIVAGILLAVTQSAVIVRASSTPSYGPTEDITIAIDAISYVRVIENEGE
ncbi:hypothetical protein [Bacillus sp. CGMCC 1.16541]|uniref:hypothetical protein n=1 Tax=Bacillus sp. CGMCC 1.16541 TaxID=2185143 RepID=UPI000D725B11|nr:hypothetical protein [Bacillus sp. CGMCC 1.16541]